MLAAASVAGGYWIAAESSAAGAGPSRSVAEEIRFACIGIGGKGVADTKDAAAAGPIVAVAEVDATRLARAETDFPQARRYTDFRRLFDDMAREFDAVTVSTPDHTHVAAAVRALSLGKHCYCQKPLTRAIAEARLLGGLARDRQVATQMGNQGTANPDLRRVAAFIAGGGLGQVREVHVWTNRPTWPQGGGLPATEPVPPTLDWDCWLGPVPARDYAAAYHPFGWRGFWGFGSGALGDMGCHAFNMPFMALDLRNPVAVQAETSGHNRQTFPAWSVIDFEFAALDRRPALKATWYDGGKLPDGGLFTGFPAAAEQAAGREGLQAGAVATSGVLVVGSDDALYSPGDYFKTPVLRSGRALPEVAFEESPGHFAELVRAIRGGALPRSNFSDYGGPLTEMVLVGNLAVWVAAEPGARGRRIEWDAATMSAPNAPELAALIRPAYRPGWGV